MSTLFFFLSFCVSFFFICHFLDFIPWVVLSLTDLSFSLHLLYIILSLYSLYHSLFVFFMWFSLCISFSSSIYHSYCVPPSPSLCISFYLHLFYIILSISSLYHLSPSSLYHSVSIFFKSFSLCIFLSSSIYHSYCIPPCISFYLYFILSIFLLVYSFCLKEEIHCKLFTTLFLLSLSVR